MFNEKMYKDILAVDCRWSELSEFCANLPNEDFDRDNSFDKYYNVETIILAIKRFKGDEITRKYLAHWANAYNWIISASDLDKTEYTWIEKHVIYTICDWLDSLSFVDSCSSKRKDVCDYKRLFKRLDEMLKNIKDWNFMYRHKGKDYMGDDVVLVFGYNDKVHEYLKFKRDVNLEKDIIEMDEVKEKGYIKTLEKKLKNKGYVRI